MYKIILDIIELIFKLWIIYYTNIKDFVFSLVMPKYRQPALGASMALYSRFFSVRGNIFSMNVDVRIYVCTLEPVIWILTQNMIRFAAIPYIPCILLNPVRLKFPRSFSQHEYVKSD